MSGIRTYYGVNIHPMKPNPMGCRWWAFVPNHRMVQADTLAGIKELIRGYMSK